MELDVGVFHVHRTRLYMKGSCHCINVLVNKKSSKMEFFTELEHLISSQSPTNATAAQVLAEIGAPSVSIAILDHGNITSKCISTIGGDSETIFQACSISKTIAGMATMRLVQAGKLQLDDKIVDLLPKSAVSVLETPHTKTLLGQITIRHLMSHTSGLSVGGFRGYSKDIPNIETVLSGKAPANSLQIKLIGLPDYEFSYSGGGMTVLQVILETTTGKDFPTLVKELVFDPLEMSRSFYILQEGEENVTTAHFTGFTPCDVPRHTLPEQAAAGLWTTPTDLLKAVRAIQRSLKNENGFLEKEIASKMLEEVDNSMALTWVAPKDPGTAFAHGGSNLPGWECFLMGQADLKSGLEGQKTRQSAWDDCGISIMTNSAGGYSVWPKVFEAIWYLKKWGPLPHFDDPGGPPAGKTPFFLPGVKVAKGWVEWKGSWHKGKKELVLEGDKEPFVRFGKTSVVRLVPAAISSIEYAEKGKSIDLILEGLEMMIRLGWKDGERSIELWYDATWSPTLTRFTRKK